MNDISIWVSKLEKTHQETKAIFQPDADLVLERIPSDKLQASLVGLCEDLSNILTGIKEVGNFRLKEVTIQVEVSAEGGVNLIGSAKMAGKGAITLKFAE